MGTHVYLRPNHPELSKFEAVSEGLKKNYWQTAWGLMLRDPEVQVPTSRLGKLFRLRFRMSWDLFHNYLLPMVVEANIFPVRQAKQTRIPLEIKILICLRRLGRGLVADDVGELANVQQ